MALAGAALVVAVRLDSSRALAAASAAPSVLLFGLGALTVLSSAWTLAEPAAAIRWGLVLIAVGALVTSAAVLSRDPDWPRWLGIGVLTLAAVAALLGIYGSSTGTMPIGERIGGHWRASGPFEYPPALATVAVMVLPLVVRTMVERSGPATVVAAFAGMSSVAALALTQSRLGFVLGVLTAVGCLAATRWGPWRSNDTRPTALALSLLLGSAAAAYLIAGRLTDGSDRGLAMFALVIAVMLALALVWGIVGVGAEGRLGAVRRRWPLVRAVAAIIAIATLTLGGFAVFGDREGAGIEPFSGLAHGRSETWRAALEVFADSPVAGEGGASFHQASAEHQVGDPALYAHSLALEAAAELGTLGLLVVVGLYALTARLAWTARNDPDAIVWAPGALVFLAFNLVDWSWHLAGATAIWGVMVGVTLGLTESHGEGPTGSDPRAAREPAHGIKRP